MERADSNPKPIERPSPAILEKAAKASIAILDAAVRRAFTWSVLGGAIGFVASLGTYAVSMLAVQHGAAIGNVVVLVVSILVVGISSTLFALYGGQVGALAGAIAVEPEIGLFRVVIDAVLADVEARYGASFTGVDPDDVDDLLLAGSRRVLGAPDSSWKGFFGFVARKLFRFLARRFEDELRLAFLAEVASAGNAAELRLARVSERARDGFVRRIETAATAFLRAQFAFFVIGVFAVALLWYPVASRVVALVSD